MKELYHTVELLSARCWPGWSSGAFWWTPRHCRTSARALPAPSAGWSSGSGDAAGAPFNINSPKQLGKVLFEDLQLPHGKKTKTGWSTNADVLEKAPLAAPHCGGRAGVPAVQQTEKHLCRRPAEGHRRRRPHPHQLPDDGNGHRPPVLHGAQPPEHPHPHGAGQPDAPDVRGGAGNLLVDADYSQIELRLLAHISGDEVMQQAFRSGRTSIPSPPPRCSTYRRRR